LSSKVRGGRGASLVRWAAVSHLTLGIGFGVGTVVTLRHLDRHGELPMTPWGFRSLSCPFEQLGVERFRTLGWSLVAVCALDVVAGVWLWQGRRRGAKLGLATSPIALVLGAGFALPFLLVGVPIRLGLLLAGRRSLR
jgi:hypothetical protein